ncbi:proton-coupled amino acid transporter-like protein pathetic [Venturia canescens]|uniref:proton-coupled amino acid transporter-like protein pathetic n=1 Tax=Venturia canescens TaxID=32260 RepID=UPI001C9C197B|nr:proton-coupled amino acid transporter-like protein pathetic [Venturia canescens]XP_043267335.1 proton-coupled amino acid transporter-like protein pathetic [Venturia canescens]XP_043267336.1 proton-coupled amino acid transporter-like protein pathetic [Venturia canescens]XP_043267337.1 proton-coupled amino acid transporter-like protein pathetic [Venturia canescens]
MSMKKNKSPPEVVGNQMNEFSSTTKINPPVIGEYHEKDELYNPFEHRDKKDSNSNFGAFAHLIKSSLGSGILAMPNAVRNGGLMFGGIGTILIGIVCAHCVHILVKSSHVLCKRIKTPSMTYAETAQAAFQCGPPSLRKYANFARLFVNAALCATYIGGVCVYVVFIAESIKQVTDYRLDIDIDQRLYMAALLPAVIILSQIRNLKYLVPFSMVANVSIMIGLALTLYYIIIDIQPISTVKNFSSIPQLPFFFATVIFAIEGIGVVMPVENSMQKPQHFLGCPSVLNLTMTVVIMLYATLGICGYLAYGETTYPIVTLNLPLPDTLAQTAKLLIALAILFTYGLQFYVPLEIVCAATRPWFSHRFAGIGETVIRVLMACMTVAIAVAVPMLEPFIALVGAVFLSILGITIPAVVETISCWECHLGTFKWRLWKNSFLVCFSIFALVTGTFVSLKSIVEKYSNT